MKGNFSLRLRNAWALAGLALLAVPATAQNKLLIEDATTFAISALGGAQTAWFAEGDQRLEKGVEVWRFTVTKDNTNIYQVRINAFTGARIKVDRVGPANGDGPAITMNRAAQIARAARPGVVWKAELGSFNASPEWHVYVAGDNGQQFEVKINATTGSVRKSESRGGNGGRR